jgi:hypothetical protein
MFLLLPARWSPEASIQNDIPGTRGASIQGDRSQDYLYARAGGYFRARSSGLSPDLLANLTSTKFMNHQVAVGILDAHLLRTTEVQEGSLMPAGRRYERSL